MSEEKYLSGKELLKPEYMIRMYAQGAFPMADEKGEISWYMPEVRTIIPLDKFNTPRSLKKSLYKFDYRYDNSTLEVIKECANRNTTWISEELIEAYKGLIKSGHLHSVETYLNEVLVGGLYGITYKGAFFGESMFSKITQASKCALVKLIERLKEKGFFLLDVQYQTEHLKMFGSVEIEFYQFTELLLKSYKKEINFS